MAEESTSSLIEAENLTWMLPSGETLFSDFALAVGREKVGLVGPNGTGKTTLLRILVGEATPTSGTVRRNGLLGYLRQSPQSEPLDTVADGLGVRGKIEALQRIEAGSCDPDDFTALGEDWTIIERTQDVLGQLGLPYLSLSRAMSSLSGGEITRVVLGRLLLEAPDVLILDEPTNNLDQEARESLYGTIERWKNGAIIVTHDRELLRRVSRILRITAQGLKSYGGNYDDYIKQVELEEEAALRRLRHAEREHKKAKRRVQEAKEKHQQRESRGKRDRKSGSQSMLHYNAQKERASRSKGTMSTQADRVLSTTQEALQSTAAEVELRERITVDLEATRVPSNKVVVKLEKVQFTYEGHTAPLIDGFDFQLIGPERVALQGQNGTGKTTLMRLIMGDLQPTAGTVTVGVERLAYLDQRALVLDHEANILANFRRLNPDLPESECRLRLAQFLFIRDDVFKPVRALSGGETMRAALACVLMGDTPPQLILLDEPSNHLDLDAVQSIEHTLRNYAGALLVISHDPDFLRNISVSRSIELIRQSPQAQE